MTYTILDVKQNLEGMLHGTSLNEITNPNQVFERAARNLLSRIDPADTIRTQQITNAVHSEIYNYTCPTDLKGRKIIDIRPQVNRDQSESFSQRFSKRFDLYKNYETFQIRYNKGVKTLRASFSILPSPVTIHECDTISNNGTWAVGGDATNLTRDTLNYMAGGASLNFDLTGSATTGYIENSTFSDVDLEDYDEIGQIFARVYIPDADIIESFTLRWGNDSSNYWSATVTSPYDVSAFYDGWQTLKFDWNGATETGTVDPEAIDYLRFTVTVSSATAETDLRLDRISVSSGEIWETEYYSECLFSTSGGTWQTTTTEDTDTINLDTDGYNIFLQECLKVAAQQLQGQDSAFDVGFSEAELNRLYKEYETNHPSEAIKPKSIYYNVTLFNKRRP